MYHLNVSAVIGDDPGFLADPAGVGSPEAHRAAQCGHEVSAVGVLAEPQHSLLYRKGADR